MQKAQYKGYEIETFDSIWKTGVGVSWWKSADPDDCHTMPAAFLTDQDAINFAKDRITSVVTATQK